MKGFTLVELLAVIIILGLIAAIGIPVVIESIKNSETKLYEEQVTLLEKATEKWATEHTGEIERTADFSRCVEIEELNDGKYIAEKEVINPQTREKMNGCVNITYDEEYNQFLYKYKEA